MELKLFRITVLYEYGKYTKDVYSTSKQSLCKGWEQYGLNKLGTIINVEEVKEV